MIICYIEKTLLGVEVKIKCYYMEHSSIPFFARCGCTTPCIIEELAPGLTMKEITSWFLSREREKEVTSEVTLFFPVYEAY
jgi:hypothetical protein